MVNLLPVFSKLGRVEWLQRALLAKNLLHLQGMPISQDTIHLLLQKCALRQDLATGRSVHSLLICSGVSSMMTLGEDLVHLYTVCGTLLEANLAFNDITKPSVYAWYAIISAHANLGDSKRALELLHEMQQDGLNPSKSIFLCTLKACGSIRCLQGGRLIHSEIIRIGLELDGMIGSILVDMYAKCGSLDEGHGVFEQLPNRNVVSGNIMISGYAQHGYGLSALDIFYQMLGEGIRVDEVTFVSILQSCKCKGEIVQGRHIHDQIIKTGFDLSLRVGSTLIDVYAKCGSLDEAYKVFDGLPSRDVVSWCIIIAGYIQNGSFLVALKLFGKMQQEGIKPDKITFSSVLKASGSTGSLVQGMLLHDQVIRIGLESDVVVGSALVDMYAKCRSMKEAQNIFDKLQNRNVVSWGSIIAGYTQLGLGFDALSLFETMQQDSIKPNNVIFSCVLKACGRIGAIVHGRLIHKQLVRAGFELDVVIGIALIDMYAKCGSLGEAQEIFDNLSNRDVISWGTMIAGYAQQESGHPTLELFWRMQQEGINPDKVTFLYAMKACGSIGGIWQGRLIHHQIIKNGIGREMVISNALIDMYAKCGSLVEAHHIFDEMLHQDVVSWSSLIAGYAKHGHGFTALELFGKMLKDGINADKVTFLSTLKACGSIRAVGNGRLINGQIIKNGFESDMVAGNTLVDMYAKCGSLEEAHNVFGQLQKRDAVSYGALVGGYAQHNHGVFALELFERMHHEGIEPNNVTFSCILKACANLGAIQEGTMMHNRIIESGLEANEIIGMALIDMYAKCGSLEEARKVFDKSPSPNVASWGAMISGYVQHGQGLPALALFKRMQQEGLHPNELIFSCILKACGIVGAIGQGMLIHDQVIKGGLESDMVVGGSIIDMYSKCGNLKEAHKALDQSLNRDVVSWGAMVAGYAQSGNFTMARQCVEDMRGQGVRPDASTYTSILVACSHTGQVDEGRKYFKSMVEDHRVIPSVAHFNCLVDILGRAGCLDEAEELLECMPVPPDITGWTSLLAACRSYGSMQLSRQCFEQVVGLNPNIAAGYVLMSNIYANTHMWKDVYKVEELRNSSGAWKKPGLALVEINNKMCELMVGEILPQGDEICAKLFMLRRSMKYEGYVPQSDLVWVPLLGQSTEDLSHTS